jgi:hypothetical protein
MHLYLNYAREHWTLPAENPPVGLILCAEKDTAVAKYALEGLPNKVLAAEYRTALPEERVLVDEIERARRTFELLAAAAASIKSSSMRRKWANASSAGLSVPSPGGQGGSAFSSSSSPAWTHPSQAM